MLLYLRNKRKQLRGHNEELSDTFLVEDSSSSDVSYSYSYYTYECYYTEDGSYEYKEYSYLTNNQSGNYESYSDFEGTYISLDDQA